jgi:hypothetical protein
MKKKILILISALSLLSAEDFDWNKIKKEFVNDGANTQTEKEVDTKKVIEAKYGVTADKEKLSDIKKEINEKNFYFGINVKDSANAYGDEGKATSNFGIFLQGKLDFASIGYVTTPNLYTSIYIYTEKIQINLEQKILDGKFEVFYGGGVEFIQDGYANNNINFHFVGDINFNITNDYGIGFHVFFPLNYKSYIKPYENNAKKAGLFSINLYKRF